MPKAIIIHIGVTPYDRIYVSGGTYLENIDLSYDPASRTLTADPGIGS